MNDNKSSILKSFSSFIKNQSVIYIITYSYIYVSVNSLSFLTFIWLNKTISSRDHLWIIIDYNYFSDYYFLIYIKITLFG